MTYPPEWRRETDLEAAIDLMAKHPFAHVITSGAGLHATRVPLVADVEDGRPLRLRGHLNAQNPQAPDFDGQAALVVFSGPSTYVSPHWRAAKTRGGTYDYQEVRVRGLARVVDDLAAFRTLIDDLSALIEPQYAEAGDYPVWRTAMAPEGYVERLHPLIRQFAIEVQSVEFVSKLHQHFPDEDRRSIVDHLMRCKRDDSRAIARAISQSIGREEG